MVIPVKSKPTNSMMIAPMLEKHFSRPNILRIECVWDESM